MTAAVVIALLLAAQEPPPARPAEQPIVVPNGRVRFINEAQVPAEVAGTVVEMPVREGQVVKKGEVLARLRDTQARLEVKSKKLAAENAAGVEAADAKVKSAEVKLEMEKRLHKSGSNAEIDVIDKMVQLDVARADAKNERARREAAHADYEKASAALDDTVVRSPFDGMVQQRIKRVGEAVQQHEPLLHVVRADRFFVESTVDLAAANRLEPSAAVDVFPNIRAAPIATFSHLSAVNAVVLLGDGRRAAAAGDDGTVTIWDLAKGVRARVIAAAPRRPVRALAVAAGRPQELAVGADDGSLRIWDVETSAVVATLSGPSPRADSNAAVHALAALNSEGTRFAVGLGDGSVRVLGRAEGTAPRVFRDHMARVTFLAMRKDALLSASDDGDLCLRELADDAPPRFLRGRSGPMGRPVGQLDWSRDGTELIFTSQTLIQIRRHDDGLPVCEWHAPRNLAGAAVFARDVALVLATNEEGEIQLWDRPNGVRPARLARTFDGHSQGSRVNTIAVTADGEFALSGGSDRTVRLWRLPSRQALDGERLTGVLAFVSAQAERGGEKRSFLVEVEDRAGRLLSNASATVIVYTAGRNP